MSRNSARIRSISATSSSVDSLRGLPPFRPCMAWSSWPRASAAAGSSTLKVPSRSMLYAMDGPRFSRRSLRRCLRRSISVSSSTRYESDRLDAPDVCAHASG